MAHEESGLLSAGVLEAARVPQRVTRKEDSDVFSRGNIEGKHRPPANEFAGYRLRSLLKASWER
jgi:hypothetical protein